MKQFSRLFFFGCLLSCLSCSNALADYSLSLVPSSGSQLSGAPGEQVSLDLMLDFGGDILSLRGANFDIKYDSAKLQYSSVTVFSVFSSLDTITPPESDPLGRITYFGINSEEPISASKATLATLVFTILKTASATTTDLSFIIDDTNGIWDADGNLVAGSTTPATIIVNPVPIPSAGLLLGAGLTLLAARRRRVDLSVK